VPIRKIPKNYRNVTGKSSSLKSEGESAFESTLERDFYALLEFDNSVSRYEVQPLKIRYQLDREERTYTPDVLVEYVESAQLKPTIFEVKYRSDLKENWPDFKPKFRAAVRHARLMGWRFRLVTEQEIRTTYLSNVKFLKSFRRHPANDTYESLILTRLAEMRETDASTLLLAIFRDKWRQAELIPSLWRLVGMGSIGVDLSSQLTMTSKLWSLT
jgi:hypothetical protein